MYKKYLLVLSMFVGLQSSDTVALSQNAVVGASLIVEVGALLYFGHLRKTQSCQAYIEWLALKEQFKNMRAQNPERCAQEEAAREYAATKYKNFRYMQDCAEADLKIGKSLSKEQRNQLRLNGDMRRTFSALSADNKIAYKSYLQDCYTSEEKVLAQKIEEKKRQAQQKDGYINISIPFPNLRNDAKQQVQEMAKTDPDWWKKVVAKMPANS